MGCITIRTPIKLMRHAGRVAPAGASPQPRIRSKYIKGKERKRNVSRIGPINPYLKSCVSANQSMSRGFIPFSRGKLEKILEKLEYKDCEIVLQISHGIAMSVRLDVMILAYINGLL